MTENIVLLSIVYILLIVLLIVLIILGIKAIFVVDNLNESLEEVNKKLHAFDGIFDFLEGVSSGLAMINKKMVYKIGSILKKISNFRKGDKNE